MSRPKVGQGGIFHLHLDSISSWEHISDNAPVLDRDEQIPLTDQGVIRRELTTDCAIIPHHELTNIDEVGISLELWDSHREPHEESVLVINTSVVFEEHRDTIILMYDCLRVESSHQIEREMLVHHMRTHDLDDGWDLGDLLEEHRYHP
jgi:hypothetical protein